MGDVMGMVESAHLSRTYDDSFSPPHFLIESRFHSIDQGRPVPIIPKHSTCLEQKLQPLSPKHQKPMFRTFVLYSFRHDHHEKHQDHISYLCKCPFTDPGRRASKPIIV